MARTLIPNLLAAGLLIAAPIGMVQAGDADPDPAALVDRALDRLRGDASVATITMAITRPDWQRSMTIDAWTAGQDRSVFWVTSPAREAGNGTLKRDTAMWVFNPKINRTIKIPPSMMSQSWMGSDFSNHDVSRSDTIVVDYTHELVGSDTVDGHQVFTVRLTPKPEAPVIWGSVEMDIRADDIILAQRFFDEDAELVKAMTTQEIGELGGRVLPIVATMRPADEPGHSTTITYEEIEFVEELPDRLFTEAALRRGRPR